MKRPEAELLATARIVFPGFYAVAVAAEARAFDVFVLARASLLACGTGRDAGRTDGEGLRREQLAGLLQVLAEAARDQVLRSGAYLGLSELEQRKIRRHGGLEPESTLAGLAVSPGKPRRGKRTGPCAS